MTQREEFESKLSELLSQMDIDAQEIFLQYALDHVVPKLRGAKAQAAQPAHAHAIDTSPERVEKQAGDVQVPGWPGEWTRTAPKVTDHPPGAELVWAVRGEPFTRPVIARSNVGARVPGFAAKAEKFVYVELMADGFHGVDAKRYPFFDALEWRGPLLLPAAPSTKEQSNG